MNQIAPSAFIPYPQFVLWRLEQRPGQPKPAKVPFDPLTGARMDPHDSVNHLAYDAALAFQSLHPGSGIGFVFTAADPFVFIDVDGCVDAGGQLTPIGQDVYARFPGAAFEWSQSGKGFHLFMTGSIPEPHRKRNDTVHVECYTDKRFVALTGLAAQGDAAIDHTAALATFRDAYLAKTGPDAAGQEWTDEPAPEWAGPTDDDELIARACRATSAASAFNGRASFADLWNGNVERLADTYPSSTDSFGRSEADSALFSHLAFWTGKDCARIERIARRSALYRDKWEPENHASYLTRSILNAAGACRNVYQRQAAERRAQQLAENARIGEEVTEPAVPAVLTLEDMRQRLVFIGSSGAVVDSVTHRVRKKDAAADEYAASVYRYTDSDTGKQKSMPALKAWIASHDRITADVLAWAPGAQQICRPPEVIDGGTRAFNTWSGIPSVTAPDDWQELAAPFVGHLTYLVPDDAERQRFTQWLAHIVRAPEVLPHTAYLMVTPQTGIGRNALASILVRVLRGYVAAGVDIASILDGRFNGRLSQKLLAIVDEVREGTGERRYQRGERLKSLVTEEHRQIDVKYGLQSVEKNCCRWLMFSNYLDALPFENSDRRIIVIANPTARKPPEYYARLYGHIDDPLFISSVRAYLDAVDLKDFRPGEHAPLNDAKAKALDAMMSDTDRAVVAFVESRQDELTTRDAIRSFVMMENGARPGENHLTKAIARAGMIATGRRIQVGNTKQSVVIVRPGRWTLELVNAADASTLSMEIMRTPGHPETPALINVTNQNV